MGSTIRSESIIVSNIEGFTSMSSLGKEDLSIKGKAEINAQPMESESMESIENEVLDKLQILSADGEELNKVTNEGNYKFNEQINRKSEFDTARGDFDTKR